MLELRINGFGGQGSVTLAHLLANAALENGEKGQALPFFGVERRGAPVRAAVRISPDTINAYSRCEEPDYVVVMSEKLLPAAQVEGIKTNGSYIVNSAYAVPKPENASAWYVDADGIATQYGLFSTDGPFINVPLFGAICRVLDIPVHIVKQTIAKKFSDISGEKNMKAALTAYDSVKIVD